MSSELKYQNRLIEAFQDPENIYASIGSCAANINMIFLYISQELFLIYILLLLLLLSQMATPLLLLKSSLIDTSRSFIFCIPLTFHSPPLQSLGKDLLYGLIREVRTRLCTSFEASRSSSMLHSPG